MKTITLNFDERTLEQLKSALTVRNVAGVHFGLLEAFMHKTFSSIDEGKTEIEIKLKKEHG